MELFRFFYVAQTLDCIFTYFYAMFYHRRVIDNNEKNIICLECGLGFTYTVLLILLLLRVWRRWLNSDNGDVLAGEKQHECHELILGRCPANEILC